MTRCARRWQKGGPGAGDADEMIPLHPARIALCVFSGASVADDSLLLQGRRANG
jgi:hypothetical protein